MANRLEEGQTFHAVNFAVNEPAQEFENCSFTQCSFVEVDLQNKIFIDCEFEECNFTLANIKGSSFQDCTFIQCKLTGLNFGECKPFLLSFQFRRCQINLASFYRLKIKGTRFIHCDLSEVDFVEADLQNAVFEECTMSGATFENTILEQADFRTARYFQLNPEVNYTNGAKFSYDNLEGLVRHLNIDIE